MSLKILQINLNHCRVAQDCMMKYAEEERADVVLMCDPYKVDVHSSAWHSDSASQRAAIWTANHGVTVADIISGPEFVSVQINGIRITSCYVSPRKTEAEFRALISSLEDIVRKARTSQTPILVAGDFNARSAAWGDWCQNLRGTILTDFLDSFGLQVINAGNKPTFVGIGRGSIVDVTLSTESLARDITNWRVRDDLDSMSDHNYVSYEILNRRMRRAIQSNGPRGWITSKGINADALTTGLLLAEWIGASSADTAPIDAEELARVVEEKITKACNFALESKSRSPPGKQPVFWWTDEIQELRRQCIKSKRVKTRKASYFRTVRERALSNGATYDIAKEKAETRIVGELYKEARRKLNRAIQDSKGKCWKELIASVDKDPWGKPYKLVMRKLRGPSEASRMETSKLLEITRSLFPPLPTLAEQGVDEEQSNMQIPMFSKEEVDTAISRAQGKNTVPGIDSISNKIIGAVHNSNPSILWDLFNVCLRRGSFPTRWKRARIVLLRKGQKPLGIPSTYRPVCLLCDTGKVLESLLARRLQEHIDTRGGLCPNQYGFRKGASTDDAVRALNEKLRAATSRGEFAVAISLDIKNAFNTITWSKVMDALRTWDVPQYLRRMFKSYFTGRTAEISAPHSDSGFLEIPITGGVPQGSVVGPLLWNLTFNEVLNLPMQEGSELFGFADDTLVVAIGKSIQELETRANEALSQVVDKISQIGLSLSVDKTEAVLFTNKYKYTRPRLFINGWQLTLGRQLTYLGIVIDDTLLYKSHLTAAAEKGERVMSALSRLMPNVGGPKEKKRRLLSAVVHSVLLYGAPSWAEASQYIPSYVAKLNRVQRRVLVRCISAYSSVSYEAINVLSRTPPADLCALERWEMFNLRRHPGSNVQEAVNRIRNRTRERWKARLEDANTGLWTMELIKDLDGWCGRAHGLMNYHLTQALTGHGCFGKYLHKIKKEPTSTCMHCGVAVDDAKHTLFECASWETERNTLQWNVNATIDETNMVKLMLGSSEVWDAISQFISDVLSKKEDEERRRETSGARTAAWIQLD